VVVIDHKRSTKAGNYLEKLGSYNPQKKTVALDAERIKHWIGNGAQVSDTVHNLLINEKIIEGKKINVLPKKSPIAKEVEEAEEAPAKEEGGTEEVVAEEAPAEEPKEEAPTEEVKEEKPAEEESTPENEDTKEAA